MKPRRQFLSVAAAAALTAISGTAWGQAYPAHPARIIVGFPAGGPQDITARIIAQWLTDRLGQQFLVESKPGAGGNIGAEFVVNSPPDGYTLLLCGPPNTIGVTLYDKLKWNFVRDTAPVANISRVPLVAEVHPGLPVKSIPELIAYAKANPNKINYGICRRRHAAARRRRIVQDDDRRRDAARALSGLGPGAHRSARRPSSAHDRNDAGIARAHPRRHGFAVSP